MTEVFPSRQEVHQLRERGQHRLHPGRLPLLLASQQRQAPRMLQTASELTDSEEGILFKKDYFVPVTLLFLVKLGGDTRGV